MNTRTTLSILAVLSLVTAAGCGARGGTNGDDDDGNGGFAGLDANGDGAFTDADLDSGTSGLYSRTEDGDSETEEGEVDDDAWLASGDGYWSVNMRTTGVVPMQVAIWFEDPDSEDQSLSTGTGDIGWVSAYSEQYLLWADSTEGEMTITEATSSSASGYFEGSIVLVVADQSESPTGQTVTIEGFAFNDVSMAMDAPE